LRFVVAARTGEIEVALRIEFLRVAQSDARPRLAFDTNFDPSRNVAADVIDFSVIGKR